MDNVQEGIIKDTKKRGRPAKTITPKIIVPEKAKGERGTDFMRLIKANKTDTIVKAFVNLRAKLYKEGEPMDGITTAIKRRIADLQAKGHMPH